MEKREIGEGKLIKKLINHGKEGKMDRRRNEGRSRD